MSNLIPFESGKLPAYLKSVDVAVLNFDLTAHAGASFPLISIKGKTFALVKDGERNIIPNPKDPESAATHIDMVIVKANKATSKIYYAKKYVEGSDDKPDCYSTDGIAPASDAADPQSPKCAVCKHNQWGSRISDAGTKGKACSDSARLAVARADQLNEPFLLRVPPASLRNLSDYGQLLGKRGVGYDMLVTRISFDQDAATPRLKFAPVAFLSEADYNAVKVVTSTDLVQSIIGAQPFTSEPAPALVAPTPAPAPAPEPKIEATPMAEVKARVPERKKVEKKEDPEVEIDLDNLSFDD